MSNPNITPMASWVQVAKYSDFTIYNFPFRNFKNKRLSPWIGIAIGGKIVDFSVLHSKGFFSDLSQLQNQIFLRDALNDFLALEKPVTRN
jgi:fumarylacetoacetase